LLQAPPREWWDNLPPYDLIIAASRAMYAALQKNCLGHAFSALSDDMTDDDFRRMKRELDQGASLVNLMIKKRMDFGLTGPVSEGENGGPTTNTTTSNDPVGDTKER
jgi:hypothetical protein